MTVFTFSSDERATLLRYFDYVSLELLQKIWRLRLAISSEAEFAPSGGTSESIVGESLAAVDALLMSHVGDVVSFYVRWSTVATDVDALNRAVPATHAMLKSSIFDFLRTHARLRYFPTGWTSDVLRVFLHSLVERSAFTSIDGEQFEPIVTIVPTADYHFAQLNDMKPTTAGGPRERFLFIPLAERDNPEAWPVLAHEVGHRAVDQFKIHAPAIVCLEEIPFHRILDLPDERFNASIARNWAAEIAADLFATDVLGMAYLACYISLALVTSDRPLQLPSSSHPATGDRIRYIVNRLHENGVIVGVTNDALGELLKYVEIRKTLDTGLHYMMDSIHFLAQGPALEPILGQACANIFSGATYRGLTARKYSLHDLIQSSGLKSDLLRGKIVASHRTPREEQESRLTPMAVRERYDEIIMRLSERRNDPMHIVSAALQSSVDRTINLKGERSLCDVARRMVDSSSPFLDVANGVLEHDTVVKKSIEIATVLSWFEEG